MKTELKFGPHFINAGESMVEVWYGDRFIASIYGADGPGIRLISRFPKKVKVPEDGAVMEIEIIAGSNGADNR